MQTETLSYATKKPARRPPRWCHLLWIVPVLIWVYLLSIVVPDIARSSGESKFIEFGAFFLLATPVMLIAELLSWYWFFRCDTRRWPLLWGIVLNLSPIYFWKVKSQTCCK